MTDFLAFTVDKFTFKVATDRYYNAYGLWARVEDGRVRVGLSDFLQQRSGDIAFAEVAEEGTDLGFEDEVASIETIKVDISLPSPVSGTVVEVNPAMEMEPDVINQDPYGEGWLAILEASDWPADQTRLLDAQAYYEQIKVEAEEELRNL